jgi:hypothetical protein
VQGDDDVASDDVASDESENVVSDDDVYVESDDDVYVESEDEGEGKGLLSHALPDINSDSDSDSDNVEEKTTYEKLLKFDLFKDLCDIFDDESQIPYSKTHFDYYDKHYDAHYKQYEKDNNKLLDMYEAVDTMMLGLPYKVVTVDQR